MSSVLNRLAWTAADASHTVCTILSPHGLFVFETDVFLRTDFGAFSAGDTGICGMKFMRVDKRRIKNIVHNAAAHPVFECDGGLWKGILIVNRQGNPVYHRLCFMDDFQRLLTGGRGEHGKIILRHDDGNAPQIIHFLRHA